MAQVPKPLLISQGMKLFSKGTYSLLMRKVTEKEQEESEKEGIDREDVLGSVVELLIDDVDRTAMKDPSE